MKAQPRPLEGVCLTCGKTFPHPVRRQGGGSRKKYCSHACLIKRWNKANPEKRKAIISRYESVPENLARKRARNQERQLRLYGWTRADLEREQQRQGNRCYGCLKPFNGRPTIKIDHNHQSNQVRGLLCDLCNRGLGMLQDSPAILRRLMAYIERDPKKVLVYLAGALKNPRIPEIGNTLRERGFDVMDEWFTPGPDADLNWQAYERLRGRSYAAALQGRAAQNIFHFDRSYIDLSDVFVLVMPAGKSAMLELGYAAGMGKRTYLLLDGQEPERYDIMPNLAIHVVPTLDDLVQALGTGDEENDHNRV